MNEAVSCEVLMKYTIKMAIADAVADTLLALLIMYCLIVYFIRTSQETASFMGRRNA